MPFGCSQKSDNETTFDIDIGSPHLQHNDLTLSLGIIVRQYAIQEMSVESKLWLFRLCVLLQWRIWVRFVQFYAH
jgi:hypothetical protein